MLVINVKDGESIERALKRYKRKHSSTGVVRKLRADRYHTKPTEAKRRMNMKAAYISLCVKQRKNSNLYHDI